MLSIAERRKRSRARAEAQKAARERLGCGCPRCTSAIVMVGSRPTAYVIDERRCTGGEMGDWKRVHEQMRTMAKALGKAARGLATEREIARQLPAHVLDAEAQPVLRGPHATGLLGHVCQASEGSSVEQVVEAKAHRLVGLGRREVAAGELLGAVVMRTGRFPLDGRKKDI